MKKVTKLAMFLLAGTLATGSHHVVVMMMKLLTQQFFTPEQQSELSKIASESSANANKTEMG